MKKIIIFAIGTLMAFGGLASNANKLKVTVGIGTNSIFERGNNGQYAAGTNEFPITPAHSPISYSFSGAYHLSHQFSLEIHSDFTSVAKVNKLNPVSMETVYTKTFKQAAIYLNADYQLMKEGRINFHLTGGAGLSSLTFYDSAAYSVPEGRTSMLLGMENNLFPTIDIGGGIIYNIDRRAGLTLDFRYVKVFADLNHIDSIIFSFRFFVFLYWDDEYIVY